MITQITKNLEFTTVRNTPFNKNWTAAL